MSTTRNRFHSSQYGLGVAIQHPLTAGRLSRAKGKTIAAAIHADTCQTPNKQLLIKAVTHRIIIRLVPPRDIQFIMDSPRSPDCLIKPMA